MAIKNFSAKHLKKKTHIFVIYTIISFVIGVVLKLILIWNLHNNHTNILPDQINFLKSIKNLTGSELMRKFAFTHSSLEKNLDTLQKAVSVNMSGIILQWLLFATTIVVYIKTFFVFNKMYFSKKSLTTVEWMKIRNEYWVFFVLFLAIDILSIGLVFSLTTVIKGWTAYTLATTTIIPVFIAGSLLLVHNMKEEVVETKVFLTPTPWVKLFSKRARKIIVPYENIKTNKALKWLKWSLSEKNEK